MRKYKLLAIIVDIIHVLVIIFLFSGTFIPKEFFSLKVFHATFSILVLISQIIMGINCPLSVLSNYLRKKADPEYTIIWDSFTLKIARKYFGVTLNQSIVFTCIVIIAVIGLAELVTICI